MMIENEDALAIIGGGNMGGAIIEGLIRSGWIPQKILVCNHNEKRNLFLHEKYGVTVSKDNKDALNWGGNIIVAVKPFVLKKVLRDLGGGVTDNHIITSIVAGVDLDTISSFFSTKPVLVRAMPNTPCSINKGVVGLYATNIADGIKEKLESMWNKLGYALWVQSEDDLDVVTALFGSGPAYVFLVMEQLQKIAESLGLDSEQSRKMIVELVEGAGQLARLQKRSYQDLRKSVTSPKGTTEAAINEMVQQGIEKCFHDGVKKALDRARSIRKQINIKGEL